MRDPPTISAVKVHCSACRSHRPSRRRRVTASTIGVYPGFATTGVEIAANPHGSRLLRSRKLPSRSNGQAVPPNNRLLGRAAGKSKGKGQRSAAHGASARALISSLSPWAILSLVPILGCTFFLPGTLPKEQNASSQKWKGQPRSGQGLPGMHATSYQHAIASRVSGIVPTWMNRARGINRQ